MRRHSKIAQLPAPLREELNLLIEDNADSEKIISFLNARGFPGISKGNIHSWIHGYAKDKGSSGYKDWLQQKQAIEDLCARQEFALDLLRQNEGHTIHDAARLLAASQLADVIRDFDVQSLKQALADQPEYYGRVVNALTKLSRDNLEYEHYRFRVAQQKARIEAELNRASGGGLTQETIRQIEAALHLL